MKKKLTLASIAWIMIMAGCSSNDFRATSIPDYSPVTTIQAPISQASTKTVEYQSIRLFESPRIAADLSQRDYRDSFLQSGTRYVWYEIYLKNLLWNIRDQSIKLTAKYYKPDGTIMGEPVLTYNIPKEWDYGYLWHALGWEAPGNWTPGIFFIEIYMEDTCVTRKSFSILDDRKSVATVENTYNFEKPPEHDTTKYSSEKDFITSYNLGIEHYNNNQYKEAIQCFTKTLQLNPEYENAYYNRALCYDKEKQYDQAIFDYTKVIELRPENSNAYHNRGIDYGEQKKYDLAIQDLNKSIELNPQSDSYYALGFTYSSIRQYQWALENLSKAIKLNPHNREAYYQRGLVYQLLGQEERAIIDFNKAKTLGQ
jgi:tetratricopeptide (TPR) repeat protein